MQIIKHNIGAQLKLPVERIVAIKGRKTYIIRYEDAVCRVPMFDWQEDEPTPSRTILKYTLKGEMVENCMNSDGVKIHIKDLIK